MWMSSDHLLGNAVGHSIGVKPTGFSTQPALENNLQKEWKELVDLTADQGDFPLFLSATLNNDANKEEMEALA